MITKTLEKITTASDVGKYFLHYNPHHSDDQILSFSSILEEIGINNDCVMKNKMPVLILSDKIATYHPVVGEIMVNKIMYDKIMYVASNHLFPID